LPSDLSVVADYKDKSSRLFDSLVYFVEKLSLDGLEMAAKQFPGNVSAASFTPKEKDDYNR
jgi:hypothetical protein